MFLFLDNSSLFGSSCRHFSAMFINRHNIFEITDQFLAFETEQFFHLGTQQLHNHCCSLFPFLHLLLFFLTVPQQTTFLAIFQPPTHGTDNKGARGPSRLSVDRGTTETSSAVVHPLYNSGGESRRWCRSTPTVSRNAAGTSVDSGRRVRRCANMIKEERTGGSIILMKELFGFFFGEE